MIWNFKRRERFTIPVAFGKFYPDWDFKRKHGELNCDAMMHRSSAFDPKNGSWTMCRRKATSEDESGKLQFCTRHTKRRPPNTCTNEQAIRVLAERAEFKEDLLGFFGAYEGSPVVKERRRQRRRVEKAIGKEWTEALNWLEKAVANGLECWDVASEWCGDGSPLRTSTLHKLFGRACVLAEEITDDCRRGRIQSAIRQWRSLFEIEVNMAFIARDTTQIPSRAERYEDWSEANYFLVNYRQNDERMIALCRKYRDWKLADHDGWTAPPDNPNAILSLDKRAQQMGYERGNGQQSLYSPLHIYTLCHSYVRNNIFAISNDALTPNGGTRDGPTAIGLDVPLCLTAMSIRNVTRLHLASIPRLQASPSGRYYGRCGDIQTDQALLEVAKVRPDSLSPLRGVDVSGTITSDDGTEYLCKPVRRK